MTLINSRPAILASFAEVARETATAIDLTAVDRRLGIRLEDELAFWFPADQGAAAAEIYRRHYVGLAERMTTALPGAREALAAVRAAGERVVIITAKHPISVEPSLRAAGLSADELFTLVHGPEKAAVLRRLEAAAHVGAPPPDTAAARAAGAGGGPGRGGAAGPRRPASAARLPLAPGVYRFRDQAGRVLYAGRAVSLRRRVLSYWGDLGDRGHLAPMVARIARVEAVVCDSAHEAAWLERNLLQRRLPPWNRSVGGQAAEVW